MLYVRKVPSLKISDSCEAAMPDKKNRPAWILLDVFVVIGIVGGVATSIGFGVPLVSSLLSELFNIEDNISLQLLVIALWTIIFGYSHIKNFMHEKFMIPNIVDFLKAVVDSRITPFLVSYFFFNNAVISIFAFASMFASFLFGFTETQILFLGIFITL